MLTLGYICFLSLFTYDIIRSSLFWGRLFHWDTMDIQHCVSLKCIMWWFNYIYLSIYIYGTSLVVQWIRICLSMQGTQVWSLVWEDSTCLGATKPMDHNYWSPRTYSLCSTTRGATSIRRLHTSVKTQHNQNKINKIIKNDIYIYIYIVKLLPW